MAAPPAAAPTPTRPLEQLVEVETPEQVVFAYSVAGIGSRAAAAAIDALVIGAAIAAIWLALALAVPRGAMAGADWGVALALLATFAIAWGYYVLFEGLRDGQTPGKRWMGLRVVQDGGYSVTLAASAVRNLLRLIDVQPFPLYGVAIVSAALSRAGKRLGDIAAGTIVVHERVVQLGAGATAEGEEGASPAVAHLTDEEYALLDRFVARRASLDAGRSAALAAQLLARVRDRFPDVRGSSPVAVLLRIHAAEREARARGAAARGSRGAARERHTIVARGAARWSDFARTVASAQRGGLSRMREDEVEAFVARYREVATDLARLRTAAGSDADAVFYLSRLVAAGHNLLYRQRTSPGRAAWRWLALGVPREIRRSWRLVALGALLLFGPAVATYAAIVRRPALAYELMPPSMINRAESARAREARGEGYLPKEETVGLPILSSAIATNNIQVTFMAFAGGLLLGLGTVVLMVFNGIAIGGAVGLFESKGVGHLIWAFVAPHGVLELSAICLAAAAGLHLATALLLPGALTRREALVVRGRRAIRLIAGTTILLLVAGAIEGFVSPRVWPMEWKLAVSAATAVMLLAFLSLGRGTEEEPREMTAYGG